LAELLIIPFLKLTWLKFAASPDYRPPNNGLRWYKLELINGNRNTKFNETGDGLPVLYLVEQPYGKYHHHRKVNEYRQQLSPTF
jgi:hypothetical protein